jgi:hypothetical protein
MINALIAVIVGTIFVIALANWWQWMEKQVTTRGRR